MCISKNSLPEIYAFLKNTKINIMKVRGADGYTALHILASNNKYSSAAFILKYSKENYGETFEAEIANWINATTLEDELTCTHVSILRGNLVSPT